MKSKYYCCLADFFTLKIVSEYKSDKVRYFFPYIRKWADRTNLNFIHLHKKSIKFAIYPANIVDSRLRKNADAHKIRYVLSEEHFC